MAPQSPYRYRSDGIFAGHSPVFKHGASASSSDVAEVSEVSCTASAMSASASAAPQLSAPAASLLLPSSLQACPGLAVAGKRVQSFVFSTDIAVICATDADAVLAVYPFPAHPSVACALLSVCDRPIFAGIGGSVTHPEYSARLAQHLQKIGVAGVVVNATFDTAAISAISAMLDIPFVVSLYEADDAACAKIEAGADIVNIAAGERTPEVVASMRKRYPDLAIMASGGKTAQTIEATIAAGADALSWTPPDIQVIEHGLMADMRRHTL